MTFLTLIVISILSSLSLSVQDIPSIMDSLNKADGEVDINVANHLNETLYAEGYSDSLFTFNTKQTDTWIKSQLYPKLAMSLYDKQQYKESMFLAQEGAAAAESLHDEEMMAECFSIIGIIYQIFGDYENALDYGTRCYQIDLISGNDSNMSSSLNNLASLSLALKHNEEAKQYIDKAIEIERSLNNKSKLAIRLGLATEIYLALGQYDMALKYGQEAYELNIADNDSQRAAIRQSQIAAVYYAMGDTKNAVKHYLMGAESMEKGGNIRSLSICYCALGDIAMGQNELKSAENYYIKGLNAAKRSNYSIKALHANKQLALLLKYKEPDRAADYYSEALVLSDSLFKAESERQINNFNIKYQTKEKEFQIEKQNIMIASQKKTRVRLVILMLFCLIIIVLLTYIVLSQRQRNRDLIEMNNVKNKFFSIISHDLRNPLIAQNNAIGQISANLDNNAPKPLVQLFAELNKSSASLLELVCNLLEWSRFETGRMQCSPVKFSIPILIKDVKASVLKLIEDKSLTLNLNIPDDAFAYADRNMTMTVLRNLIGNAIKFSHPSGTIELLVESDDQNWRISVVDHGVGMSKIVIDNLFRIDSTISSVGTAGEKGSGLGLIITREMVEKNGGKIDIKAVEGVGTTVSFTIKKG